MLVLYADDALLRLVVVRALLVDLQMRIEDRFVRRFRVGRLGYVGLFLRRLWS